MKMFVMDSNQKRIKDFIHQYMEKTNNQRNFVICGHGGYGITGLFLYHPEVGAMLHFATLAIIACADINQLH